MAKDDYTCDVCGEYALEHDPDCYFGINTRRRAAEAAKAAKAPKKGKA